MSSIGKHCRPTLVSLALLLAKVKEVKYLDVIEYCMIASFSGLQTQSPGSQFNVFGFQTAQRALLPGSRLPDNAVGANRALLIVLPRNSSGEIVNKETLFCPYCGEDGSAYVFQLENHCRDQHRKRRFPCRKHECEESYEEPPDLTRHINRVHRGFKHIREECGKPYTEKDTFTQHMRYHTGNLIYCKFECGVGYPIKSETELHESYCLTTIHLSCARLLRCPFDATPAQPSEELSTESSNGQKFGPKKLLASLAQHEANHSLCEHGCGHAFAGAHQVVTKSKARIKDVKKLVLLHNQVCQCARLEGGAGDSSASRTNS